MHVRTSHLCGLAALALLGLAAGPPARAQTFAEKPGNGNDVGQSLTDYQDLSTGTFTTITGHVRTADDADLYRVYLTGTTFTADTAGSGLDTQLFLFNAAGQGVAADDDVSGRSGYTSRLDLTGLTAGYYFLGISGYNYDPYSAAGYIFPDAIRGQQRPGNSGSLSGWSFRSFDGDDGDYTIALTGTGTAPRAVAVPEPTQTATLGLGALGLAGLMVKARRRRPAATAA